MERAPAAQDIARENQELRDALKKNAAELALTLRELEIEAALERVRSRTLVMKESSELNEAVAVLFQQFQALCLFPTEARTYFCHINADTAVAEVWMTHTNGTVMDTSHQTPLSSSPAMLQYFEAWKRKDPYIIRNYSGEALKEYLTFISSLPHTQADHDYQLLLKSPPEKIVMTDANFLQGNIGIMTFEPLSRDAIDILVRFAKVFEFTYTRFLDLKKAEAQAREAKIEAALEKARSRTMGMQSSDELPEVANVLFLEVQALGIPAWSCGYNIVAEDKKSATCIMSSEGTLQTPFKLRLFGEASFAQMGDFLHNEETMLVQELGDHALEEHYAYMKSFPDLKATFDQIDELGLSLPKYQINHLCKFAQGFLLFITYEKVPHAHDIFKRFTKVFEQTYTRFLDLQKAEAQVREAQIETSLERIRSRAMAMYNSNELGDAAILLYRELQTLGITPFINCGYVLIDEIKNTQYAWMTHADGTIREAHQMPLTGDSVMDERYESWKRKDTVFHQVVGGEQLKDHLMFVSGKTNSSEGAENVISHLPDPTVFYCCNFSEGYLHILSNKEFSKESETILSRFTTVFEITYRRFLDLQKAEAQARESQIQLAMERVRARTMAMQRSEELPEVAALLFQQVKTLGVPQFHCGFNIFEIDDKECTWYPGSADGDILPPCKIPLTEHPVFMAFNESRKRGDELFVYEKEGEYQASHYRYMLSLPVLGEILQNMLDAGIPFPTFQIDHLANFSHGNLLFITSEHFPEMHDTFKRFAKVFEQTYTRFLDLQKSEAHAREIEIDLALERVRAQTMAMHNSEDVGNCILKMFGELTALGVDEGTRFGIGILNHDNENIQLWTATKDGEKVKLHIGHLDMSWHPLLKSARKAWLKQVPLHQYILEGEDLVNYYQMINNAPDYKLRVALEKLPEREVHYGFVFDQGFFYAFNSREFQPELIRITQRFSSLFGQTYRRYLDLVKAERQAREAEIELALERVRARTMAMQKSPELNEVAAVLFEQIRSLGGKLWGTGFALCNVNEGQDEFWFANEAGVMPPVKIPNTEDDVHIAMFTGWKENQDSLTFQKEGAALAEHYQYLNSLPQVKAFFAPMLEGGHQFPTWQQWHAAFFSHGYLLFITIEPYPEPDIFKRFAKVFDQTYTRFLDLKKAEAQARESQIQLAMERVRARTMAMQHSSELSETSSLLFQQIQSLGVPPWSCGFNIWEQGDSVFTSYMGRPEGVVLDGIKIPLTEEATFIHFQESRDRGDKLFVDVLEGETLEAHYRYFLTIPGIKEAFEKRAQAGEHIPTFQINHLANFSHGNLMFITYEHCPEAHDIFTRFAKVFEQTYTRFLDLQKAEAQVRESQVQAALERVRSRTMAMHQSHELSETSSLLFQQIKDLGLNMWSCGFCIWTENNQVEAWMNAEAGGLLPPLQIPFKAEPTHYDIYKAFKQGKAEHQAIWEGEALKRHYAFLETIPSAKIAIDILKSSGLSLPEKQCYYVGFFKKGYLLIITQEPDMAALDLTRQFASVFDLTFTRFLDLKNAEAQARDAQIEAALEKVRSRSMAMQTSSELGEVIQVVVSQFVHLNIAVEHAGFIIDYKKHDDMHIWLADKHVFPSQAVIPYFDSPHWNSFVQAKEMGIDFFTNQHDFEEKNSFYQKLFSLFPDVPQETKDHYLNCPGLSISTVLLDNVGLYIENFDGIPFTPEENATLMRFGKVFQQTYTRFEDLQKAETRAKEAKIEAALERTRTQSMLMQHSEQLDETLRVFHEQVLLIGIDSAFSFLWLPDEKKDRHIFWAAWAEEQSTGPQTKDGRPFFNSKAINYPLDRKEPATAQCLVDWKSGESVFEYHVPPSGVDDYFLAWKELLAGVEKLKPANFRQGLYYVEAFMKYGCFGVMVATAMPHEDKQILGRFAIEFERTYTRFLDLQKAEVQAREAAKQAALDRIRADIASMRTTTDLDRITPLIWNELTILGIPFSRCGVFIMDDTKQTVHSFLSNPDGKAIAAFHVPYHNPGNLGPVIEYWQNKRVYITHWDKTEFRAFADSLVKDGMLDSSEQYLSTLPDDGFHLHFLPFLQGMFYVGSANQLDERELTLIQLVAEAFSTAYARYEDFNKLEAAKLKVDQTLVELKQAQLQLIQAEKMASLGELTAGIAHEIQNPLNFVNNFSDVNKELIAEMKEEIDKGNIEEAKEIANDIEENENKINHHGKRADSIVKGMLQHSRQSTGQKEPTDLNALIDEYLKLSYQALRSKDKSFNSAIETNLDKPIGKIEVVPQDLGRVLLNLYNNAFYAVNERRKLSENDYHPRVDVTTKKLDNWIEISVIDNGTGIPQDIVDRIYNPFFTTKPTGEGTGLGLSLSYDIIKAHGGEIKVETKDGEGTTFKLILPVT